MPGAGEPADDPPWPPVHEIDRLAAENEQLRGRERDLISAAGAYENQAEAFAKLFGIWIDLIRHDGAALIQARDEIDRAIEALFQEIVPC